MYLGDGIWKRKLEEASIGVRFWCAILRSFCNILSDFALKCLLLRVERGAENPCVTGSIPVGTTIEIKPLRKKQELLFWMMCDIFEIVVIFFILSPMI